MIDHKYIPLLSKKSIHEMTPSEFKVHVIGLFWKPEKKRKAIKKISKGYSARVNDLGNLIITLTRKPKFLTEDEVFLISTETGKTLDEVYQYAQGREIPIQGVDAPENNSQISLSI